MAEHTKEIRGLSLTQPWASLAAWGKKRIETRSWRTPYRGWVAIHAAKAFPKWAKELALEDPHFLEALSPLGFTLDGRPDLSRLPLGAIVAVGRIHTCVDTSPGHVDTLAPEGSAERAFGDYSPGRWLFVLEDVRELPEPIPCVGALSLWPIPDPVLTEVRDGYRAAIKEVNHV